MLPIPNDLIGVYLPPIDTERLSAKFFCIGGGGGVAVDRDGCNVIPTYPQKMVAKSSYSARLY